MKKITVILILLTILSIYGICYGLATEQIGPDSAQRHPTIAQPGWPKGIVEVLRHQSRVYSTWVNGNEHYYYQGDTEVLNDVLAKFADIEAEVHEVIVRPSPGQIRTFDGEAIKYNWLLHIVEGISKHMTTLDMGAMVWSKYPQITVYVSDGEIDLNKIKLPKGVTIVEIDELSKRYTKALYSSDKTVRGWGCHSLAGLDPYSKKNMAVIATLLDDKNEWVRLNALGALGRFGKMATSALPKLKELLKDCDEKLRQKIEEAIKKIENAEEDVDAVKEHRKILKAINKFYRSLPEDNRSALTEHEVVSTVREFLTAIDGGDYDRAIGLGIANEFKREGLVKVNEAFELEKAEVIKAYVGNKNAAVLTNAIPTQTPVQTVQFGYSLVENSDRWLIRDVDLLPNNKAVQQWLAGFKSVEPTAKRLVLEMSD